MLYVLHMLIKTRRSILLIGGSLSLLCEDEEEMSCIQ